MFPPSRPTQMRAVRLVHLSQDAHAPCSNNNNNNSNSSSSNNTQAASQDTAQSLSSPSPTQLWWNSASCRSVSSNNNNSSCVGLTPARADNIARWQSYGIDTSRYVPSSLLPQTATTTRTTTTTTAVTLSASSSTRDRHDAASRQPQLVTDCTRHAVAPRAPCTPPATTTTTTTTAASSNSSTTVSLRQQLREVASRVAEHVEVQRCRAPQQQQQQQSSSSQHRASPFGKFAQRRQRGSGDKTRGSATAPPPASAASTITRATPANVNNNNNNDKRRSNDHDDDDTSPQPRRHGSDADTAAARVSTCSSTDETVAAAAVTAAATAVTTSERTSGSATTTAAPSDAVRKRVRRRSTSASSSSPSRTRNKRSDGSSSSNDTSTATRTLGELFGSLATRTRAGDVCMDVDETDAAATAAAAAQPLSTTTSTNRHVDDGDGDGGDDDDTPQHDDAATAAQTTSTRRRGKAKTKATTAEDADASAATTTTTKKKKKRKKSTTDERDGGDDDGDEASRRRHKTTRKARERAARKTSEQQQQQLQLPGLARARRTFLNFRPLDRGADDADGGDDNDGGEHTAALLAVPYETLHHTTALFDELRDALHDPDRIQAPPLFVGLLLATSTTDVDTRSHSNDNDDDGSSHHHKSIGGGAVCSNFDISSASRGKAHFLTDADPRLAHAAVDAVVLRWRDRVYVVPCASANTPRRPPLPRNDDNNNNNDDDNNNAHDGLALLLRVLRELPGVELITFHAPALLLPLLCAARGALHTHCVSDVRVMAWMAHVTARDGSEVALYEYGTLLRNCCGGGGVGCSSSASGSSNGSRVPRTLHGGSATQTLVNHVYYLAPLYVALYGRLGARGLLQSFLRQEKQLALLLTSMKRNGFVVDVDAVQRFKAACAARMHVIRERAAAYVPQLVDFNIQSHEHCRHAIYELLGLGRYLLDDNGTTASNVTITKGGRLSTAEDTLKLLARWHAFPRLLLSYRKVAKLQQTYLEGMMAFAIPCGWSCDDARANGEKRDHTAKRNDDDDDGEAADYDVFCDAVPQLASASSSTTNTATATASQERDRRDGDKDDKDAHDAAADTTTTTLPCWLVHERRAASPTHTPIRVTSSSSSTAKDDTTTTATATTTAAAAHGDGDAPPAQSAYIRYARLHANFVQEGTDTGRLSCVEPNLQHIPRVPVTLDDDDVDDGDDGDDSRGNNNNNNNKSSSSLLDVRRCFVAPPGFCLLSVDYQQIELRVLAHLCEDAALMRAMTHSTDIHRTIAELVYKKSPVSNEERNVSKRVVFGILYGAGPRTLAAQVDLTVEEAMHVSSMLKAAFPRIATYHEHVLAQARRDGFVRTLGGRVRDLPDLNSSVAVRRAYAERQAFNTVVQGSAADIVKTAMLALERDVLQQTTTSSTTATSGGTDVYLLTQIHDEVVLAVRTTRLAAVVPRVLHAMAHATSLLVPLCVNAKVGRTLADMEEWSVDHSLGIRTVD